MNHKTIAILTAASLLAGCATMERPENAFGSQYAPQQFAEQIETTAQCRTALAPAGLLPQAQTPSSVLAAKPDMLASGDRVRLNIAGDTDSLSRVYVVAANGSIILGGRHVINLAGKSINEAERSVSQKLVAEGLIRGLPQ